MTVRALPVPFHGYPYAYSPPRLEDAVALLRSGRAAQALRLLERLPATIEEERRAAVAAALAEAEARVTELQREVARLNRELARPLHKNPRTFAAALAEGRITVERAAELLGIRPEDVPPIAEGRVGLAGTAWRRLLREVGEAPDKPRADRAS